MWALFLIMYGTVFPLSPGPQHQVPDDRNIRVKIVMKIY